MAGLFLHLNFSFVATVRILTVIIIVCSTFCWAQEYADPEYYLVDSLVLEDLYDEEIEVLEKNLEKYHNAENDSVAIVALARVTNALGHPIWEAYNYLLYQECRKILKKNKSNFIRMNLAGSINNMGYAASNRGDSYLAADYYIQSADIFGQAGDSAGMALGYLNVANIYKKIGEIELSNEMDQKGLEIALAIDNPCHIALGYHNLGLKLNSGGLYEDAMEKYDLGLKYSKLCDTDKSLEALFYSGYADIYTSKGEDSLADAYYQKSLDLRLLYDDYTGVIALMIEFSDFKVKMIQKKIDAKEDYQEYAQETKELMDETLDLARYNNSKPYRMRTYVNLSTFYRIQGNYSKARTFADSAYAMIDEVEGILHHEKALESKYLIAKIQKDHKGALEYYEKLIAIREQLRNNEAIRQATQEKYKIEYLIQSAKDSAAFQAKHQLAEKEIELKNNQIATSNRQMVFLIIGILLIAVFSFFLYKKFQQSQEQKAIIEDQKAKVEEAHQEIKDSINYAKRIQAAILPPKEIVDKYLKDSFIIYLPKDVVAGDFYWLQGVDSKPLFAAADCTGHGVPGAMVSVVCNNALNRSVKEFGLTDPGKILDKTREIVIDEFSKSNQDVKDGMDIALCYLDGMNLQFAGANNSLWLIRDNELIAYKGDKQPVGNFEHQKHFTTHQIELKSGDTIYLFSDGIVDQFGGDKGKKFKPKSLKDLLLRIQDKSIQEQKEEVIHAFNSWKGDYDQIDDVCVIGVRI